MAFVKVASFHFSFFNFVIEAVIQIAPPSCENSGLDIWSDEKLPALEYPDEGVHIFGLRFAPSKGKILLHDWIVLTPNLVLAAELLGEVDRFSYSGCSVSSSGRISEEVSWSEQND